MTSKTFSHLDLAVYSASGRPGIYRLYNKNSCKSYVGQAVNLRRRLGKHLGLLKLKTHAQPVLRKAFAKHGPEAWVFEVIEECAIQNLTELETLHAKQFNAFGNGYNCAPIQSGVQVTEEFRLIAREAAKKFHARTTDAQRSEIAKRAADTRRDRAAASRRSRIAKKAAATRASRQRAAMESLVPV
ncbi:MAG: GIY-YIG nuclease family protein [Burkholderiales bacterium]